MDNVNEEYDELKKVQDIYYQLMAEDEQTALNEALKMNEKVNLSIKKNKVKTLKYKGKAGK